MPGAIHPATMTRNQLALVLMLGVALAAAPAHALYVMTPLRLTPTDSEGNVGDKLAFHVSPDPESNVSYAGQTLTLRYTWDPNEGSESSEAAAREGTGPQVALDAKGEADLTWTIPAEVDDRNVGLSLIDGAGEAVAFAYVRVGDAQPQMRTMAGSGGMPPASEIPEENAPSPHVEPTPEKAVPGAALAVTLGALALASVARRW